MSIYFAIKLVQFKVADVAICNVVTLFKPVSSKFKYCSYFSSKPGHTNIAYNITYDSYPGMITWLSHVFCGDMRVHMRVIR